MSVMLSTLNADGVSYTLTGAGSELIVIADDLECVLVHNNAKINCAVCTDCIEPMSTVIRLKCGHMFHTACIRQAARYCNICPLCRAPFNVYLKE